MLTLNIVFLYSKVPIKRKKYPKIFKLSFINPENENG
jgi:hypothetical protein